MFELKQRNLTSKFEILEILFVASACKGSTGIAKAILAVIRKTVVTKCVQNPIESQQLSHRKNCSLKIVLQKCYEPVKSKRKSESKNNFLSQTFENILRWNTDV